MDFKPVKPIGRVASLEFLHGATQGRMERMERNEYPKNPTVEQFKQARRDAGITMRTAAERAGIDAVLMSQFEQGEVALSEADYAELQRRVFNVPSQT